MNRIVIGIDPGKQGAIAFLDGDEAEVHDTPVMGGAYLVASMAALLDRASELADGGTIHAYLERYEAMPMQGRATLTEAAYGVGLWAGLLAGRGIATEEVRAGIWKRAMGLDADKANSIALAQRLYPQLEHALARRKDHGRAEALLIAEWGRRRQLGGLGVAHVALAQA